MTDLHKIHIAILAGGKSTRMGTDKRFLKINDQTLVERATHLAEKVVTPYKGQVLLCGLVPYRDCLPDLTPDQGPISGLYTALEALDYKKDTVPPWLLVLPVDMPLLNKNLLNRLIDAVDSRSKALQHEVITPWNAARFSQFEMPFIIHATSTVKDIVLTFQNKKNSSNRSFKSLFKQLRSKQLQINASEMEFMSNVNCPEDWDKVCKEILTNESETV